jgi:hypothetical protein
VAININFEHISNLQCKVRALQGQIQALESGDAYLTLRETTRKQIQEKDSTIKKLKRELFDAERRIRAMRKNWMQVYEDIEAEHIKKLKERNCTIEALKQRAFHAEKRLDSALDAMTEKERKLREVQSELEEEKKRCQKLKSQLARDYENSSIPSSAAPNHKKIANGRERTGRAVGGQTGHTGHRRKRQIPTDTVTLPPPKKYTHSPKYRLTGKTISKQIVGIRTILTVTEYSTPEFRDISTGQRVHAAFPKGLINDVTYDGTVKALAFLLNSHYCMPTDKVRTFLFEITGGALNLSCGMINGLGREFSDKTAPLRKKLFADILSAPVLNTDFTATRLNAKPAQVAVCATLGATLYFAREHKGHEGVKDTPVQDYQGILVHDHDKTYYRYASLHQECLSHVIRYLKSSIETEPELTWNTQMLKLIREMIHFRNHLESGSRCSPDEVAAFETRYQEVIAQAKADYEHSPPRCYYRDGYNLFRRMDKYAKSHLLFLHNLSVPANNNLSERLLRIFKRKQRQALSFRSFENLSYLCDSLGVIASLRIQEQSLLPQVAAVFNQDTASP